MVVKERYVFVTSVFETKNSDRHENIQELRFE